VQPGGVRRAGVVEEEQGEALVGEQGEIGACLPASREVDICEQMPMSCQHTKPALQTDSLSLSLSLSL
jgi:hypothetical protein